MKLKIQLLIFSLIVLFATPNAFAQPLTALEALASKDVLAIAWVDLEKVQLKDCLAWASEQEIIDSETSAQMASPARMARAIIGEVSEAGVDHVFALVHQEDLVFRGPPLIVFSVSDSKQIDKALQTLQGILAIVKQPDFKLEVWKGTILGGTKEQIARVKAEPVIERPRLVKAWKKYGGHDAGVMIIGSGDTRRALRELFPKLDPPFENITSTVIADDIDSIGITFGLPKEVDGELIIQTSNEATAKLLKDAADVTLELIEDEESERFNFVPSVVCSAILTLKPKLKSDEITIDLKPLLNNKNRLQELLQPILR